MCTEKGTEFADPRALKPTRLLRNQPSRSNAVSHSLEIEADNVRKQNEQENCMNLWMSMSKKASQPVISLKKNTWTCLGELNMYIYILYIYMYLYIIIYISYIHIVYRTPFW